MKFVSRIYLATLCMLLFVGGVSLTLAAEKTGLADSPWPMYHGDLKLTGQSKFDTARVDGTVKWKFKADAQAETSPVLGSDGTIYFGDHDCNLYAINPDGTQKWKSNFGDPVTSDEWGGSACSQSTPAVAADGTIYFANMSKYLFAVNPDGTEKWRYPIYLFKNAWPSPTIAPDGTIYIGSESYPPKESGLKEIATAFIHAINPDGTRKWAFDTKSNWSTSTPSIGDDGTIYTSGGEFVQSLDKVLNTFYAFNPDGSVKWRFRPPNGVIEGSVTIGPNGTLFVTAKGADDPRNGNLYALNPDGTLKWKFPVNQGISITAALANDGTLYFGDWGGMFYAINSSDGKELWRVQTPPAYEALSSPPAIGADGTIYFGTIADMFLAFNPDGTEKWRIDVHSGVVAAPAIGSDGTVYFISVPGELYAVGSKDDIKSVVATTDETDANSNKDKNFSKIGRIFAPLGALVVLGLFTIGIFLRPRRKILWISSAVTAVILVVVSTATILATRPDMKSTRDSDDFIPETESTNEARTSYEDEPCPHHIYGSIEKSFYGAFHDKTTRDFTYDEVVWMKDNCPGTMPTEHISEMLDWWKY